MSLMALMIIEGLALATNADRLVTDPESGVTAQAIMLVGVQMFVLGLYSLAVLMAPKPMLEGDPKAARRLSLISLLCGVIVAGEGVALALVLALRGQSSPGELWTVALFVEMFALGGGILLLQLLRGRGGVLRSVYAAVFLGLASIGLLFAGIGADMGVSGLGMVSSTAVILGGLQFLALAVVAVAVVVLQDRPELQREFRGLKVGQLLITGLAVLLSLEGLLVCGFAGDVVIGDAWTLNEGTVMQVGLVIAVIGLVVPLMAYADAKGGKAVVRLAAMAATFLLALIPFALIS